MEVMRSLEKMEDWEKLEIWMVVVWLFLPWSGILIPELMEGIEQVTLKSLLQQPSALLRFEDLCEAGTHSDPSPTYQECKDRLQRICGQVRVEQLPSESPQP